MTEQKPQDSRIWATVTIAVAIVGCIGAIGAALISVLPNLIKTAPAIQPTTVIRIENTSVPPSQSSVSTASDVSIRASADRSGTSAGGDLLTFSKSQRLTSLGDTKSDQTVRSFLSFYIGDLPIKIEVLDANLDFQCEIAGNPEKFGKLILQNYTYGVYEKADFSDIPPYEQNWYLSFSDPQTLINNCRTKGRFYLSSHSITQLVQQNISNDWIQFVFYFENQSAIVNQSNDSVTFVSPPLLSIRYREVP